jgi:hypothetical protein
MKRQYLIDTIEALWPPDSQYQDTAERGQELYWEAMERCELPLNSGWTAKTWRNAPIDLLEELAQRNMHLEWNNEYEADKEIQDWWDGYLAIEDEQ